ncbi:hypothetical protein OG618_00995 [Kitasatospora sp. NBC_01246]|uniref:hypothetical protein n=1 Tax=Kitasatospora sp. NBC_01246 TaxID=2903570 RepID=UPI002E2F1326|nr:hypothetical protein [Kitasatospora sp. NBC_01246]
MENAELGDLTGRARQAVRLGREGASPVQVAAADRILEQDPFGPAALFTGIDPTAAAVAAAHWLAAAAEVTAEATGHPPTWPGGPCVAVLWLCAGCGQLGCPVV